MTKGVYDHGLNPNRGFCTGKHFYQKSFSLFSGLLYGAKNPLVIREKFLSFNIFYLTALENRINLQ